MISFVIQSFKTGDFLVCLLTLNQKQKITKLHRNLLTCCRWDWVP